MPVGGGAYDAPAFGTNAICRKANPAGPATPGAVQIMHPGWIDRRAIVCFANLAHVVRPYGL